MPSTRILYVNSNLVRLHTAPGIWGTQVREQLSAAGAHVQTVPQETAAGDATEAPAPRLPLRRWAQAMLPRWVVGWLLENYLMARGAYRSLRTAAYVWRQRHRLDVDVVLGRHTEYECSSALAARILKVPLVMEVHSPTFVDRQARGQPRSRLVEHLERRLWAQCAGIWVNSANLKSILAGAGVRADRLHVIPFGVARSRFSAPRAQPLGSDVDIVFVGSFYQWHGVAVLLRAFAAARATAGSMHLTLIGDGDELPACQRLAADLGVAHAVTFAGRLRNDEVFERLARADIGVAPYLRDDRFYYDPAKILEYLASGLPVIASDQGRVAEMLDGGRCGVLVRPGDEDALRDALILLANDRPLRQAMGQAGLERATDHYRWDRVAARVLAVLDAASARPAA